MLAHNAFNDSILEPYTGRLEINDYLEDLQLPQMLDLALKYDTEIMVRVNDITIVPTNLLRSGVTLEVQTKLSSLRLNSITMLSQLAARLP